MKYSKRVREDAALICAIAASNHDVAEGYISVAELLGIGCPKSRAESLAESLAFEAWRRTEHCEHPDAEAEALIRTGWTP